jgi:hypothetical protein
MIDFRLKGALIVLIIHRKIDGSFEMRNLCLFVLGGGVFKMFD